MNKCLTPLAAFLLIGTLSYAQDANAPVSRAEYNKLKADLKAEFEAELKAQREQFKKELAEVKAQVSQESKEESAAHRLAAGTGGKDYFAPILGTPVVVSPGTSKLTLTGGASATYVSRGARNNFSAVFNPVLLWEINDRLRFEGDVVFSANDGTSTELQTAEISYDFCDYLTLGAGRFANPTNYFAMNMRKYWINKLPNAPLGLLPMFEDGVQLSGEVPIGSTLLTYAAFVGQSPVSKNFGGGYFYTSTPDPHYSTSSAYFNDVKTTLEVGARIGFQPIPGLEIGYGIETFKEKGTVKADEFWSTGETITDEWGYTYTDTVYHQSYPRYPVRVRPVFQTVDLNYFKDLNCLKGTLDLHAQWTWQNVGCRELPSKYNSLVVPFEANRNGVMLSSPTGPRTRLDGWPIWSRCSDTNTGPVRAAAMSSGHSDSITGSTSGPSSRGRTNIWSTPAPT